MSVLKTLWKLKGLFAFLILIIVVVIVVAVVIQADKGITAPEVSQGNAVVDKESNNNASKPQNTGLTLNLDEWISIEGVFDSNDDRDRRLAINNIHDS